MLRTRIEDREVEYLLSRRARDDADDLVSLLATLNLERLNISVEDREAGFAATAVRLVHQAESAAPTQPVRSRLVPRLATAALTGVLIMGLAGVAQAADAAAPGDTLYGLDRALERVGINDGGLDERLDEAQALTDAGQSDEALAHLAEALGTTSPNAANALRGVAEQVESHDNPSQAVLEDVADMLRWMAETEASGREFGQGVAELARQIGAGQGDNPPATLPDNASGNQGNGDSSDDSVTDDSDSTPDSSGSSGGGGNSGEDNSGRGGGSGSGNGPPGGSPPGRSGK